MQMELQYSLCMALEEALGVPSIYVRDGVTLPSAEERPYTNVRGMQNNNSQLSKLRESMQTTFHFQVGLFPSSDYEKSCLQGQIRDLFMFGDKIPLYNELGELTPGFFSAEITNEVPVSPEDLSDKSKYHRVYFDVQVTRIFHKNKGAV